MTAMEKSKLVELKKMALPFFKGFGAHGFDHTERVLKFAVKIAEKEGADLETVQAAAILHDIAREMEDSGKIGCHADKGAEEAEKILLETSFPKEKIPIVKEAIFLHRFKKGKIPKSLEGKVLQDADRLETLGAIAIARIFSRGGEMGRPLYDSMENYKGNNEKHEGGCLGHFRKKIFKITPEKFNTKTAQKIAKHRYKFTQLFVKEFLEEWKGKK